MSEAPPPRGRGSREAGAPGQGAAPGGSGDEAARAFVLKLARGLHRHGYPAHLLEAALQQVARRLGIEAQFFSLPTALFASFGPTEGQRTHQIRVDPGAVDLGRLALLETVTDDVAGGRLSAREGAARLDGIEQAPVPYGPVLTTLCYALASGSAARFFGGGTAELATAAAIGLVAGLLALVTARSAGVARIFEPLAATLGAALATFAAARVEPVSVYVSTLAGLIVLVPGFTLTVAMTELATRNLVSGTARLAGALGTFLSIGFGVALGTSVAGRLVGTPVLVEPVALPGWTQAAALVVAPLAFTVLLRAQPRDAPWVVAAGVLAFAGARAGARLLGPELGAFAGALLVGVAGSAYSRLLRRPASVAIVPGLLLLVPGSIGFLSVSSLLERQTVSGIEAAFRMTLVLASLVTGLLLANVVLPQRTVRDAPPA